MAFALDSFRFVLVALSGWMNSRQLLLVGHLRKRIGFSANKWGQVTVSILELLNVKLPQLLAVLTVENVGAAASRIAVRASCDTIAPISRALFTIRSWPPPSSGCSDRRCRRPPCVPRRCFSPGLDSTRVELMASSGSSPAPQRKISAREARLGQFQ